jgi:hypothetical protein
MARTTDPQRLFLRESPGNAGELRQSDTPALLMMRSSADRVEPVRETPAARRGFLTSPAKYGGKRARLLRLDDGMSMELAPGEFVTSVSSGAPSVRPSKPRVVDFDDTPFEVDVPRAPSSPAPSRSKLPALALALAIGAVLFLSRKMGS